jgi:hypothetical protein
MNELTCHTCHEHFESPDDIGYRDSAPRGYAFANRNQQLRAMSSDITKCIDKDCLSKEQCFRWTAKPHDRQSYADFNRPPESDKCDSFEPNGNVNP